MKNRIPAISMSCVPSNIFRMVLCFCLNSVSTICSSECVGLFWSVGRMSSLSLSADSGDDIFSFLISF